MIFENKVMGDFRGKLIALESDIDIPFQIRRVFYIFDVPSGQVRGEHAHYKTKQYIAAISGSCKITLDNGKKKQTYSLNSANKALFQDCLVWGEMFDFTDDCILLVLASELYTENDYIRNYQKFLEKIRE